MASASARGTIWATCPIARPRDARTPCVLGKGRRLLRPTAVTKTLVLAARHMGGKRCICGSVMYRVLRCLEVVTRLGERGAGSGNGRSADRRIVRRPLGNVRRDSARSSVHDMRRLMSDDRGLAIRSPRGAIESGRYLDIPPGYFHIGRSACLAIRCRLRRGDQVEFARIDHDAGNCAKSRADDWQEGCVGNRIEDFGIRMGGIFFRCVQDELEMLVESVLDHRKRRRLRRVEPLSDTKYESSDGWLNGAAPQGRYAHPRKQVLGPSESAGW